MNYRYQYGTRWVDRKLKMWDLVDEDGNVYFGRWQFQFLGRNVFIHRFMRPDPLFHSHPWPFISIILRGGYVETYGWMGDDYEIKTHRFIRRMPATDAWHEITKLLRVPTWTLVITGKDRGDGGGGGC